MVRQHESKAIVVIGAVFTSVLSRTTEQDVVPFEEIAGNKEPYEICRLFLATLQLVRQYTFGIAQRTTMWGMGVWRSIAPRFFSKSKPPPSPPSLQANQGNVEIVCENDMAKKKGRKAVDERYVYGGRPLP
jgi:hypothetical protein